MGWCGLGQSQAAGTQVYSREWTCTQVKSKKSFHLILTFIGSTIDAIAARRRIVTSCRREPASNSLTGTRSTGSRIIGFEAAAFTVLCLLTGWFTRHNIPVPATLSQSCSDSMLWLRRPPPGRFRRKYLTLTDSSEARHTVKLAIDNQKSKIENPNDWPTYRHDPARSGFTKTSVPAELKRSWQTDLGGKLSSVVLADGKLFVASIDTHTVYALDESSGKILWSYTTGGRIDSPPTIYQGRVLFGSADGWIYCLAASDGALAWRFRAAPKDLRLTAFEQLESVWPVHGSVLVQDDPSTGPGQAVLYCVAGRSMFLDGGIRFLRLDPKTGQKLSENILDDRDPETGKNLQVYVKGLNMPVALPDVLSSDGRYIYMRSQRFDLEGTRQQIAPRDATEQTSDTGTHLFCTIGFLDDSWFHRSYWMFGKSVASGWGGWPRAGRYVPSGRIIVCDESSVYGFSRKPEYLCQSSVLEYQLYAADKQIKAESIQRVVAAERRMNASSKKGNSSVADRGVRKSFPLSARSAVSFNWLDAEPPLHVRAMVLANTTLFIAGPPDVVDEEEAFYNPNDEKIQAKLAEQNAALGGRKGGLLLVVSASDGKKLTEYKLESIPVWDGMAAANGRLYLATKNGKILCFAGNEK